MTLFRIPRRAVISLDGTDTLALLERTVTHTVLEWALGEMRYGALLTPQGKVVADYLATRSEDGVLIDVHEDAADDLIKRLKMFRLRADVEIALRGDAQIVTTDDTPANDPREARLPGRQIVTGAQTDPVMEDWDGLAIALGIPEWGRDYRAAEVFPTDINMDHMNGIDYRKGCFVGQEVASRMKRKGVIRKRTLRVQGEALEAGADILAEAPIGTVTSAKDGIGLAQIRLDRLAKADTMTCNGKQVGILDDPEGWAAVEIAGAVLEARKNG